MTRLFDMTIGQDHELKLALQNAGMTLEDAVRVAGDSQLAVAMVATLRVDCPTYPARDFNRYTQYLLPLDVQLQRLVELNKELPKKLRVPEVWFNDVDTSSDHIQTVEDLEFFFIVPGTVEETLTLNWELIRLTQPAVYRSGFKIDADNLRLWPNTRWYEPGLHRIRINLVDNWDPENGRNVDDIRTRAAGTGVLLASVEPIGAYALHAELFRQQDGENLPYCDLAGLRQVRALGRVPCFRWYRFFDGAYLGSWWSGVYRGFAAPSLRGVQN